jgi:hypothetical protein
MADASFGPIVGQIESPYRLSGRSAISESEFHLFKPLRRPVKSCSFCYNFKWLRYNR